MVKCVCVWYLHYFLFSRNWATIHSSQWRVLHGLISTRDNSVWNVSLWKGKIIIGGSKGALGTRDTSWSHFVFKCMQFSRTNGQNNRSALPPLGLAHPGKSFIRHWSRKWIQETKSDDPRPCSCKFNGAKKWPPKRTVKLIFLLTKFLDPPLEHFHRLLYHKAYSILIFPDSNIGNGVKVVVCFI